MKNFISKLLSTVACLAVYACVLHGQITQPATTGMVAQVARGNGVPDLFLTCNAQAQYLEFINLNTSQIYYCDGTDWNIEVGVNADWNATSGASQILNKPTIPAAQVNSDWNSVSGVSQIINKPSLSAVATSGSYNDLINKPTIGTVSSFSAPSTSWPSWLVPTVNTSTTTPSLAVVASAIPNSAIANVSTTVNSQTCTLGSSCTISVQPPDLVGTGTIPSATIIVAGCSSAVVIAVSGAVVGHRVDVMSADGSLPPGTVYYQGSVTSSGNVSAVQCATVALVMSSKSVRVTVGQ